VNDPVGYGARRHSGDSAEQQRDHVALVGWHFLADDQPQHGGEAYQDKARS